jgi:hypothetical protein
MPWRAALIECVKHHGDRNCTGPEDDFVRVGLHTNLQYSTMQQASALWSINRKANCGSMKLATMV